ncbi:uncharacterized protein LOC143649370 [Tamandua tetradactyla]|uniref:uncharacterized protein LOC143649370 n=1 Tax=Tamandua tetradactyla TaxID=48850 RepID=UPI004054562B
MATEHLPQEGGLDCIMSPGSRLHYPFRCTNWAFSTVDRVRQAHVQDGNTSRLGQGLLWPPLGAQYRWHMLPRARKSKGRLARLAQMVRCGARQEWCSESPPSGTARKAKGSESGAAALCLPRCWTSRALPPLTGSDPGGSWSVEGAAVRRQTCQLPRDAT